GDRRNSRRSAAESIGQPLIRPLGSMDDLAWALIVSTGIAPVAFGMAFIRSSCSSTEKLFLPLYSKNLISIRPVGFMLTLILPIGVKRKQKFKKALKILAILLIYLKS